MSFLAIDSELPAGGGPVSKESDKVLDDLIAQFGPMDTAGISSSVRSKARKVEGPPPLNPVITTAIKGLSITVTRIIAIRCGDKWIMTGDEAEALAEPLHRLLEKYSPGLGAYGDELAVGMVLLGYLMLRVDVQTLAAPKPKPKPVPRSTPFDDNESPSGPWTPPPTIP